MNRKCVTGKGEAMANSTTGSSQTGLCVVIVSALAFCGLMGACASNWRRAEAETDYPPVGRGIVVQDHITRVTVCGPDDGEIVLYSHGVPGGLGDAEFIQERLAKQGFRVIAYDRLGHGYSYPTGLVPVQTQIHAIDDVLEQCGVPTSTKVILVGHSWGGGLSLLYATTHRDRVRALVLLSSETEPEDRSKCLYTLYGLDGLDLSDLICIPQCSATCDLDEAFGYRADEHKASWIKSPYAKRFVALTTRSERAVIINGEEDAMRDALKDLWTGGGAYSIGALGGLPVIAVTAPWDANKGRFTDPEVKVERHTQKFCTDRRTDTLWCEAPGGKGHMLPVTDAGAACDAIRLARKWADDQTRPPLPADGQPVPGFDHLNYHKVPQ